MSFSITVKVKKVSEKIGDTIPFPHYATTGSAGLDLPACLDEPLVVPPGARMKIPTGIAIEIPFKHIVGLVFPRSGLATKHGISLANAVGVIDSDYKGEIIVAVYNQSISEYIVNPGERVAQLLFLPVYNAVLEPVEELEESGRGEGGFGSTGKV
ncbi:dUTP diphosphatase [Pelotomaculum sp. PtaB.Bin117]|nr:dUTP diphosphatase [Pelotomaculum sp. PtaB.Bin117]OPX85373.1 MAG: Deoxyuridine 5'-triphosphate nucleotidohydrolase [Pelotomaculum sp. PtaB.Bin117]OPY62694.1 MAG: Deoxyuridine 5'-triphosphate nucleotidohydrolase [Pelotomaculum sp. PtaU1.Bin065]